MLYVAILRALRVLKWYAIVLAVIEIPVLYATIKNGPWLHVRLDSSNGLEQRIPLDVLMFAALFGSLIVAMFVATGLDAEYKTAAIAWTRPIGRLTIAARYLAVAAAALVAAWALALAAEVIPLAAAGLFNVLMFTVLIPPGAFALLIGSIVMWFGLIVLAAALFPGRGGAIAGMSWGVFFVLGILAAAPFPPELHVLTIALNFINPLAYLGGIDPGSPRNNLLQLSGSVRGILCWAIGFATTYAGVVLWAKREVPA
jgi:hypothetical protein